jgi:hypothetical protein
MGYINNIHIHNTYYITIIFLFLFNYFFYLTIEFFQGFLKFIEKVHFDESVPENHNINITNLKSKYLHIYENNQWTAKEKAYVLDKFIN